MVDKKSFVVVGIDFGTTFSGLAFSFRHEYQQDPTRIQLMNWNRKDIPSKGPTSILIGRDGKHLKHFGYEAETKYSELAEEKQHTEWYYFRRFKMLLHREGVINIDVLLEDATGKKLPALEVFSMAIKFFKNKFLDMAKNQMEGLTLNDVLWILTVPAIWNDTAKQFMRKAAEKGIHSEVHGKSKFISGLPPRQYGRVTNRTIRSTTQKLWEFIQRYMESRNLLVVFLQDSTAAKDALIVAAIDFGTTYSGVAFSFKHEYQRDPTNIKALQWTGGQLVTLKGPTSVLVTGDGKRVDCFGYDAETKYSQLADRDEHRGWFFFRHFKMLLHGDKVVDYNVKLKDAIGKELSALKVFSLSIEFLKNEVLKMATNEITDAVTIDDFDWVLTVPAIWSDSAKQFMRKAAESMCIILL